MRENWQINLGEYINRQRRLPFEWGTNDCITFSNGAVRAMTGKGFADDWQGDYNTALGASRFFRTQLEISGFRSIIEAIDGRLKRAISPPRGAIVAREAEGECIGFSIGVLISSQVAFVGLDGLEFAQIEPTDMAWATW